MTALALLADVRALLDPPRAWLPGLSFAAVDAGGRSVLVGSPAAARFGVLGALMRLGPDIDERMAAIGLIRRAVGAKHLCDWEMVPERTQAEVLHALDAAIALARDGGRP